MNIFLRWVQYLVETCCSLIGVLSFGFYRPWWDYKYIFWLARKKCNDQKKTLQLGRCDSRS